MSSGFEAMFRRLAEKKERPSDADQPPSRQRSERRKYQRKYRAKRTGGLDVETIQNIAGQFQSGPSQYVRNKHAHRDAKSSAAMRKVR